MGGRHILGTLLARPLAVLLILLALSSAVAACGGSDRLSAEEYRAELASLNKGQEKPHTDVEKAFSATSVAEMRTLFTRFADSQDALGDDVAALKPPKDAESANADLVSGAHAFADNIRALVTALSDVTSPKAALKIINQRGANASKPLDDALDKLMKLGYAQGG